MNTEDNSFMNTFLIILGILILFTVAVFTIANMLSNASSDAVKSTEAYQQQQAVEIGDRIMKVGSVETFDPSAKPEVRSGKQIYDAVCTSCHQSGVLNAPKVGVADDWKPRMTGGFDGLVAGGTNGKGAMPPKGGDASLGDLDMQKVVAYMLKESGLDAPDLDTDGSESAAPTTTPTAPAETSIAPASTAPTSETVTQTITETATSAATTVTATAAAATAAVTGAAASTMKAITGIVPKADKAAAPKVAAISDNLEKGKGIYKTACFACHDSGVAGAPKLGDKAAWEPRIAAGMDAMMEIALNGKRGMPPKGGRLDLSTEDIQAAVAFMASEGQ